MMMMIYTTYRQISSSILLIFAIILIQQPAGLYNKLSHNTGHEPENSSPYMLLLALSHKLEVDLPHGQPLRLDTPVV